MVEQRKNEIFEAHSSSEQQRTDSLFDVVLIDSALPSNGKVYDVEHPLHSALTVSHYAMTTQQENILTNKTYAKRGTAMTQLIQSCLVNKKILSKNLLIGDRNTIMVSLRVSGYGADYDVKVTCPKCETESVQKFALDKLPIRRLELEPVSPGTNLFEFKLPMSKHIVRFRFLTGADEEEISQTQTNKKKTGLASDDNLITTSLMHSIVSIGNVTDRNQISLSLPKMPAYDSQALRRYISDNDPGIQLEGEMHCPNSDCEFVGKVGMPLGANFFWPGAE